MALALRKVKYRYTYGDYLHWDDSRRWEIIDGEAYDMSPAPTRRHQRISIELVRQLSNYLVGKKCEAYSAPFDVVLPVLGENEEESETVVQPDIVVVCDQRKLTKRGCTGAPEMVIEILSPSTAVKDLKVKKDLYERAGVREYWIVHPDEKWVNIFLRDEKSKLALLGTFSAEDTPEVNILPGLQIDLAQVFAASAWMEETLEKNKVVHGPPGTGEGE